jgi:hypothetical protein
MVHAAGVDYWNGWKISAMGEFHEGIFVVRLSGFRGYSHRYH